MAFRATNSVSCSRCEFVNGPVPTHSNWPDRGSSAKKGDELAPPHAWPPLNRASYRQKLAHRKGPPCPLWVRSRHMQCLSALALIATTKADSRDRPCPP